MGGAVAERAPKPGEKGLRRPKRRISIRIDMTPMVHIAFLLLIFYMVSTVFSMPQAMEINLPPIDQEEEVEIKEELAIQTVGLKKHFGRGYNLVKAVDGIDLAVKEGEVHGYLGPNGAGKTTSMLMIAGTIRPTEGKGYIFGKAIGSPAANEQLGVAIANPKFFTFFNPLKPFFYP